MSARKRKTDRQYKKDKADGKLKPLHEEEFLCEWKYWRFIENKYPHNRIVKRHYMVVLKRECHIFEIAEEELKELWYTVFKELDDWYDFAKVNFQPMRSINNIPHIHICEYRRKYK